MANFGPASFNWRISIAIGGYIWNKFSQSNKERHLEILNQGDSINENVRTGVVELKAININELLFCYTFGKATVPAKAFRDVTYCNHK